MIEKDIREIGCNVGMWQDFIQGHASWWVLVFVVSNFQLGRGRN
jgi:hypothetical protein